MEKRKLNRQEQTTKDVVDETSENYTCPPGGRGVLHFYGL